MFCCCSSAASFEQREEPRHNPTPTRLRRCELLTKLYLSLLAPLSMTATGVGTPLCSPAYIMDLPPFQLQQLIPSIFDAGNTSLVFEDGRFLTPESDTRFNCSMLASTRWVLSRWQTDVVISRRLGDIHRDLQRRAASLWNSSRRPTCCWSFTFRRKDECIDARIDSVILHHIEPDPARKQAHR